MYRAKPALVLYILHTTSTEVNVPHMAYNHNMKWKNKSNIPNKIDLSFKLVEQVIAWFTVIGYIADQLEVSIFVSKIAKIYQASLPSLISLRVLLKYIRFVPKLLLLVYKPT